eukprot:TRINITY_DN20209_c0_g1_i2.p1 TRINITY_DN20209_c0_g1~~TRINITY_DN20209_c0_g1_i2.p1  ORF type:complete len:419 (+),score=47.89 TRINITY_DN20209_c0_g1_i2:70-1257(+)
MLLHPLPEADLLLIKDTLTLFPNGQINMLIDLSVITCPRRFKFVMFVHDEAGAGTTNTDTGAVNVHRSLDLQSAPFKLKGLETIFSWQSNAKKVVQLLKVPDCAKRDIDDAIEGDISACPLRPRRSEVRGATHLKLHELDESMKDMLDHGAHKNGGYLKVGYHPKKTRCVQRIPKNIHFIWVGTALLPKYADNIILMARRNQDWKVFLYVDHYVPQEMQDKFATNLSTRAAGNVEIRNVSSIENKFRNKDLIQRERNLAGKSDYMRMEVLYLYGGIYFDTDAHAVHGFDEYDGLFQWPFVAFDKNYKNVGNCVYSADKGSAFLDFALTATRENCLKFNVCGVMSGAGPGFLTGAYLRYNDPNIQILDQYFLVQRTRESVNFHTMDATWLKPGGSV